MKTNKNKRIKLFIEGKYVATNTPMSIDDGVNKAIKKIKEEKL